MSWLLLDEPMPVGITGHRMNERPEQGAGNWGDWRCLCCKPSTGFCQDCGAELDATNRCTRADKVTVL